MSRLVESAEPAPQVDTVGCGTIGSSLITSIIHQLSSIHFVTFVIRPQSVLSHLRNRLVIDCIPCVNYLCSDGISYFLNRLCVVTI